MKCPVCRAPYRENPTCSRCQVDLSPLIEIRNRALIQYNRALEFAKNGEWNDALKCVDRAIHFFRKEGTFYLLHGKILAHLHRYKEAYNAWQLALQYDSLAAAQTCLSTFQNLLYLQLAEPASQTEKSGKSIAQRFFR